MLSRASSLMALALREMTPRDRQVPASRRRHFGLATAVLATNHGDGEVAKGVDVGRRQGRARQRLQRAELCRLRRSIRYLECKRTLHVRLCPVLATIQTGRRT